MLMVYRLSGVRLKCHILPGKLDLKKFLETIFNYEVF
jgi:hypothetical protein